jgi:hypothetical protein
MLCEVAIIVLLWNWGKMHYIVVCPELLMELVSVLGLAMGWYTAGNTTTGMII